MLNPSQKNALEETISHMQQLAATDKSGHDWWHIHRVRKTALYIAKKENAELFIVQMAALLHDIADWKFNGGDELANPRAAFNWLSRFDLEDETVQHICTIVRDVSFRGAGVENSIISLEGKIVQDADRLDAIGAIGIARTFTYGGYKGMPIFDPQIKPTFHATFEEYKRHKGTTINHFHEKLLLLKERMNTATAKQLAEDKHNLMLEFLNQFSLEWSFGEGD